MNVTRRSSSLARLRGELRETFGMALHAITAHKLRSGLTLLGVLVGVFSIILVMTAMRAVQNNIERQLGAMGSQTFAIQRAASTVFSGPADYAKALRRKEIFYAQGREFQRRASFAPVVGLRATFITTEVKSRFGKTPPTVGLEGGTPGSFPASNWALLDGRALLEADVDSARDVCVVSKSVAESLFPRGSSIGERIKIASVSYQVVGVFEKVGSGDTEQALAVIPITSGLNRYGRLRAVSILVQARDPAAFEETMEQARGVFRAIRKVPPGEEDDFELLSSDAMIAQFQKVTAAVRIGLTLVSSIALLAAGVGIMNIMLVSVTERTREIGIRRAIGARKRSIMLQFIMEAVVLCEIGGLFGIAAGVAGANALAIYLLKLPPAFPLDWAILALVICSLVGIVFGSYPAYKAANLDPIESLRYE